MSTPDGLLLDIPAVDYDLSRIVRLTEQEGVRIVAIHVEPPRMEGDPYRVDLRTDRADLARVSAAMRRHGYTVIQESTTPEADAEWAERAEAFLKYLEP